LARLGLTGGIEESRYQVPTGADIDSTGKREGIGRVS
jgi:hypothetical protein